LRRFGIDTSLVRRIETAPTGTVSVNVDAAGKPAFTIHADSAWDRIAWTPEAEAIIAGANAVYFGTLGQRGATSHATLQHALAIAKARGSLRVLDVNLRRPFFNSALIRQSVEQATVLKLSDEELPEVASACGIALQSQPEATLQLILRCFNLALVAMTRGADGALLVSSDEIIDQPGIQTTVVDTVGAGDSFTAALVIGLLGGDPLASIAFTACKTASAVCAISGAVPNIKAMSR
jgi:fructokinase